MAKIPVTQAPAGPAVDAAVAEVQGIQEDEWPWHCYVLRHVIDMVSQDTDLIGTNWCYTCKELVGHNGRLPHPWSTDIAAAWELVEDAKENCWAYFIDELEAGADSADPFDVVYYLTPETITRAYLKAKGIEEIDIPD